MSTETATVPNPNEGNASAEAPATPAAAAADQPGNGNEQQPVDGQKPADGDQPAGDKPGEGTQQVALKDGAPDAYEFKAPEGSEYDPKVLEAFSSAAKEANLTQDAAQKLIEKMAPALAARQVDQVKAIQDGWREQAKSDKEIGGEKLSENLAIARKAYDAFDPIPQGQTTTPLRTLLETTGLGNHPEMIRLLYRAGKAISEDRFVPASRPATAPKSVAETLYGSPK